MEAMTAVEEIQKRAESLSDTEFDQLIDGLLASRSTEEEFAPGYDEVIARRIDEIKSGKVEGIPHDEVMKELRSMVEHA